MAMRLRLAILLFLAAPAPQPQLSRRTGASMTRLSSRWMAGSPPSALGAPAPYRITAYTAYRSAIRVKNHLCD